ncbi:DNA polymerase delta subunit 4 isoform X3 [Sturnira hondurensis]|uniref:DNA polymerase delta subunit 4 isoform X3 n=1 Tax=Sturnira hondurensis TaxID=192404 RepID=UPI001879FC4C|nr:DNA polymerase delta subunit 4 isoform X3 [Sturnira hondurensis]
MDRKRLITDSYPVVKRRESPTGHSKGKLAPELEEETPPLSVSEVELELLRQFDLAWQYGPCTGITRLQRWHRAQQMGLEPPPEVRQPLAFLPTLRNHHLRSPAHYPRTSVRAHCCPSAGLCCGERLAGRSLAGKERAESGGFPAQPSI